jgi:hypothetical protein
MLKRILLLLFSAVILSQCKKPDQPKIDPHQCDDMPDYVSPDHEWLQANHIGDTLNFNVYRVVKNDTGGRSYVYLRKEQYIATDTGTEIGYRDFSNSVCPDERWILHEQVLYFEGPDKMWSKISPEGYFDRLWIFFKGEYFEIPNDAYLTDNEWTRKQYFIGDTLCYNVKLFTGAVTPGSGYIDSTYCFYNKEYGILKFIINDTTAYIRQLNQ